MNPFLLIIGGIVGTTGLVWAVHLKRLKKHTGMSREDFVHYFETSNIQPEVTGAVYDHFQKLGVWKGFKPNPADTLEGTYKTVEEDVEESLKEVLQRLNCEFPHSGILQEWTDPVETISDVVLWVDWARSKLKPSIPAP